MRILIWGSMSFAQKMFEVKSFLEQQGHEVHLSPWINFFMENPNAKMNFDEELNFCKKTNIMNLFFDEILESDAILFLNYDKKWISGYIGTSVLMELWIAYHNKKKIYLLNDFDRTQWYGLEVAIIDPIILNWDLSIIK